MKSIYIENVRSIEKQVIEFPNIPEKCFMFFGVNGSGKSNILRAFELFRSNDITSNDFRFKSGCNQIMVRLNYEIHEEEDEEQFKMLADWIIRTNLFPKGMVENTSSISILETLTSTKENNGVIRGKSHSCTISINRNSRPINPTANSILDNILPKIILWKRVPDYIPPQINLNKHINPQQKHPLLSDIFQYMTGTDNYTNELTQLLSNERKLDKFFDSVSEKLNRSIAESWTNEIEFRFKVLKDAQNNTILKIYIDDKNLDEYMCM